MQTAKWRARRSGVLFRFRILPCVLRYLYLRALLEELVQLLGEILGG
jgi:hypothetical protein